MCVKSVMALPIHLILDKEEGKCDLNFDSTFDTRKRRNQISYVFAMHLIPVKGEVKHVNNFDARQRRVKGASKVRQRRVKGVQRHHGFAYL